MTLKVAIIAVVLIALSGISFGAVAQSTSNWVTAVTITDLTGNSAVQPSQPLLAGHAYNVTMTITVPFTQSTSDFSPQINSSLLPHGAFFWYVRTPNYPGYNRTTFASGSHTVNLTQIAGTLVLSGVFTVPLNLTTITGPGLNFTRHVTLNNYPAVTVSVWAQGSPLERSKVGQVTVTVEDQTIQTYLTTYQQKSTLLSSGQINSAYSGIVNSVLDEAQALYSLGLPAQGTNLLNTLNPSSFPSPPNTTTSNALLAGVAVAAVVIVLLAILILRGRGKRGYSTGVVSEVQKEMALLEVTAAKYDKALADRLKALRDRLGEAD